MHLLRRVKRCVLRCSSIYGRDAPVVLYATWTRADTTSLYIDRFRQPINPIQKQKPCAHCAWSDSRMKVKVYGLVGCKLTNGERRSCLAPGRKRDMFIPQECIDVRASIPSIHFCPRALNTSPQIKLANSGPHLWLL